ncbi:TrmB family transcriptional regulator [Halorubrum gandharaense]
MEIEEFEMATDEEDERSTSEEIVKFLLENKDRAWKRSEIAEAIDRDPNTVGTNLSRLKERGLVRHRENHWAITNEPDRLAQAIRFSNALSTLTESFGAIIESEKEAKAWSDAQPDQPHPSVGDEDEATELIEIEGENGDDR